MRITGTLLLSTLTAILAGVGPASGQAPKLSIVLNEKAGSSGRLSTIAVDSLNQPHIACDGGTFVYFYDKIGASWRSTSLNAWDYGSSQYYNPHLEIDRNNVGWYSGILFRSGDVNNCGIGMITRINMPTDPSTPNFSRKHVDLTSWDTGNASVDMSLSRCTAYSSGGFWESYEYDAAAAGGSRSVGRGQLYAGRGGEANSIYISKGNPVYHPGGSGTHAVWHVGTVGAPSYDSCMYQNSMRQARGQGPLAWLTPIVYGLGGDGVYCGLTADSQNPEIAYLALDAGAHGGQGIWANVYNGTAFVASPGAVISINPNGAAGTRYAPSMCPALNGGAFICYSVGSQLFVRYIGQDGSLGSELLIGSGVLGAICTDSQGDLHVAYNSSGIRYCKIAVADNKLKTSLASDFDGDGKADVTVFRSGEGSFYTIRSTDNLGQTISLGTPNSAPVPADYDGDGKADYATFMAKTATWTIRRSSDGQVYSVVHGTSTDIPVPANYSGDRKAEIAVFRPETSTWYIRGQTAGVAFGSEGDTPIPSDFNGDGLDEIAVFRPSAATWFIYGQPAGLVYGSIDFKDIPIPADYDGDGKSDLAIYRPEVGMWYAWGSTAGALSAQLGSTDDIPVPGKYDHDAKVDFAIYRKSTSKWYVLKTSSGNTSLMGLFPILFGGSGDRPVPQDYDDDGKTDFAVYRPSTATWYIYGSRTGAMAVVFGAAGDVPVPADYDHDGKIDFAVFRPSIATWYWWGRSTGPGAVVFGAPTDIPVPGDFNGDDYPEFAVFRPGNATWYIAGIGERQYGSQTDTPAHADHDNDGDTDLGVFRGSTGTWYWWTNGPGTRVFGPAFSTPIAADYDYDGKTDLAVYENSPYGKWWILGSKDKQMLTSTGPITWGVVGDTPIGYRGEYK